MYFDLTVAPCLQFEKECLQTEGKSLNYTIKKFITYYIGEVMLANLSLTFRDWFLKFAILTKTFASKDICKSFDHTKFN